jgi:hypothetical protein
MRRLIPLILAFLMLGAVFAIPPVQQPSPQQQTQTKEDGEEVSHSHLSLPIQKQDSHFAKRRQGEGIHAL